MIDLNIRPRIPIIRSLLQIKRMEFIRLCRRTRHQAIEYGGIPFDTRTIHIHIRSAALEVKKGFFEDGRGQILCKKKIIELVFEI